MTADNEQWKPIPNFPGYEVSDQGRVRSYHIKRGNNNGLRWQISDAPQRILSPNRCLRYDFVLLSEGRDGAPTRRIHKLVMLAFVGPCPDGLEICHNNGDSHDNRLSNLRYDTHSANMRERKDRRTK